MSMLTVEAEREVDALLAHADFERRMGSGEHAETPLREALRDALVDKARLEEQVEELEEERDEYRDDAEYEESRADELRADLDKARADHEAALATMREELADERERREEEAVRWDHERAALEAHVADLEGRLEEAKQGAASIVLELDQSITAGRAEMVAKYGEAETARALAESAPTLQERGLMVPCRTPGCAEQTVSVTGYCPACWAKRPGPKKGKKRTP